MRCGFCEYRGAFLTCIGICTHCGIAVCAEHGIYAVERGAVAVLCQNCYPSREAAPRAQPHTLIQRAKRFPTLFARLRRG